MFVILPNSNNVPPKNYLPPFEISPKLEYQVDKLYFEFIGSLYLNAALKKPPLSEEDQMWFLEQIAAYIKRLQPSITKDEHIALITKIIHEYDDLQKGTK